MKITETKIYFTNSTSKKKGTIMALATIIIDNCFCIHNIKIILGGNNYLFIAFPSYKEQGKFKDIVHPIDTKTREYFSNKILSRYFDLVK